MAGDEIKALQQREGARGVRQAPLRHLTALQDYPARLYLCIFRVHGSPDALIRASGYACMRFAYTGGIFWTVFDRDT